MVLPFDPALLSREQFVQQFPDHVDQTYDTGWLLFANPNSEWPGQDELMPAGAVFANYVLSMLILTDSVWFPWTSRRNILEAALQFFRDLGKGESPVIEFATLEDKRFFERMCEYGVMRRIGTAHSVAADGRPVKVFEVVR